MTQRAKLNRLADRAAEAQEREHNTGRDSSKEVNAFEEYAKSIGYEVIWPGLYPVLVKDGDLFHLD